jgi:hypothetical protein
MLAALLLTDASLLQAQTTPASTAPAAAPMNLLSVGDWGFSATAADKSIAQVTVAKGMADYAKRTGLRFEATMVLGDNFKDKLTGNDDPKFTQGFDDMFDRKLLPMPFYALMGSHDHESGSAPFELTYGTTHPQSRWKMPAQWYRLELPAEKPLITVFMLDSNQDLLTAQEWKDEKQWMAAEFAKPRNTPWTVVFAHHPLFSNGRHGDSKTLQDEWGGLLKTAKADFYITGHDHILQQLQMPDWTTTFILNGGGGENINRPVNETDKRGPFVKAMHGFMHMQFEARKTTVRFIDQDGVIVHAFERDTAGKTQVIQAAAAK